MDFLVLVKMEVFAVLWYLNRGSDMLIVNLI